MITRRILGLELHKSTLQLIAAGVSRVWDEEGVINRKVLCRDNACGAQWLVKEKQRSLEKSKRIPRVLGTTGKEAKVHKLRPIRFSKPPSPTETNAMTAGQ